MLAATVHGRRIGPRTSQLRTFIIDAIPTISTNPKISQISSNFYVATSVFMVRPLKPSLA
jgi:hypothetical protein